MTGLSATLIAWALPVLIIGVITAVLAWLIARFMPTAESNLPRQLSLVVLAVMVPIALLLSLPFDVETRGQLLNVFGLVVTAVIALASTSTVSNVMAGLTLRGINSFHIGDFIHISEHFGRVTERGLLHTEIQSVDRDLITLPNVYVAQNPVKVVRTSGTLISADVSIGYDVHRSDVSRALVQAAEEAELSDSFVQITELGNFAVHYRISGFLGDIGNLVSRKTRLHATVLDALHDAGVEVMTPNVMAQRPIGDEAQRPVGPTSSEAHSNHAEQIMFDKADVAARIAQFEADKKRLEEEVKSLSDDPETNEHRIRWRNRQIESLNEMLATLKQGHGPA